MNVRGKKMLGAAAAFVVTAGGVLAQQFRWDWEDRDSLPLDRRGVPDWKVDPEFKHDLFTFVRVEYDSRGWGGRRRRGGGDWKTDWPDSDLNFPFRLQQLTSMRVDPQPISLRLTDPRLFDYPFLYMIEPGDLLFSEEEVVALRRYLENGGFMMVDDFWGDHEYNNFAEQMKRVFTDRDPVELDIDHQIFQMVYKLKEKPQVPSIHTWERSGRLMTYEPHGGDSETVHYRALFDKKDRMVVIICHNTDLGDGWEREAEDPTYFKEFSEKLAYPMGINIVTYAMTH